MIQDKMKCYAMSTELVVKALFMVKEDWILHFTWPKKFLKIWNGNLYVNEWGGEDAILADKLC